MDSGLLIVVSGPAGVGKGTILKKVMELRKDLCYSVSATSRLPRPGETEGINYFYKTKDEFEKMIKNNQLIEWVKYCGNYYGTPKNYIEEKQHEGYHVVLEIEIEGAMKIKKEMPEAVFIFILPPSFKELERRITKRGTESQSVIKKRMKRAKEELLYINEYNYFIINDDIEKAVIDFNCILQAEILRTERNKDKLKYFFKEWSVI